MKNMKKKKKNFLIRKMKTIFNKKKLKSMVRIVESKLYILYTLSIFFVLVSIFLLTLVYLHEPLLFSSYFRLNIDSDYFKEKNKQYIQSNYYNNKQRIFKPELDSEFQGISLLKEHNSTDCFLYIRLKGKEIMYCKQENYCYYNELKNIDHLNLVYENVKNLNGIFLTIFNFFKKFVEYSSANERSCNVIKFVVDENQNLVAFFNEGEKHIIGKGSLKDVVFLSNYISS